MSERVLTPEQIEEAKFLRDMGKSKREIAEIYHVGQTTIWENVFATVRRVRPPRNLEVRVQVRTCCMVCGILMKETTDPLDNLIPHNYRIGTKCLDCYLHSRGIRYIYIMNLLK